MAASLRVAPSLPATAQRGISNGKRRTKSAARGPHLPSRPSLRRPNIWCRSSRSDGLQERPDGAHRDTQGPLLPLEDFEVIQEEVAPELLPPLAGREDEDPWTTALMSSIAASALGALLFGFHSAVINAPLAAMSSDLGFADSDLIKGSVVSIMVGGGMVGGLATAPIADAVGRRKAFQIMSVPLVLGSLLSALAQGPAAMVIGRLVAGVGVGASSALVPMYLSEVSPPKIRGKLNGIRRVAYVAGCLGAFVIGQSLAGGGEGAAEGWWRPLFFDAAIPALIMGGAAALELFEESPVWLLAQGRDEEARASLVTLQGVSGGAAVRWADECRAASEATGGPGAGDGFAALLRPENRRPVFLGLGLCTLAALSGSNTVIFYASTVFRQLGMTSPCLLSLAVGLPNLVGALAALHLTDRAGRRPLLLGSFAGMGACLAILALFTGLEPGSGLHGFCAQPEVSSSVAALQSSDLGLAATHAVRLDVLCRDMAPTVPAAALLPFGLTGVTAAGAAALVTVPAFVFFFSVGAGPIPWLLYNEIFPTSIRATATSCCTSLNYLTNTLVGISFLPAVGNVGLGGTYAAYAAFCLGGLVFVDRMVVETKGRSLQEIELMMTGGEEAATARGLKVPRRVPDLPEL